MARRILISGCILLIVGVLRVGAAESRNYPSLPPVEDQSALGVGVQRTMALLARSTPQHRNHVRILFYGQSITEQEWWRRVADDLRRRFPNADLEIENRAIGGFASQLLIRPAEHDLYPFYPDLLIFHVYGANQQYEQIIRSVRTRTTAEVLMQKDHVTAWPPQQPDPAKDKGLWWDHMMNHVFLPEIAKKYDCALVDVRTPWLEYLRTNNLQPRDLLKDGVHLNDHGNYLLAELIKRYLVYRPELAADASRQAVSTIEVGTDVKWNDGRLALEFEGNRVDVIAAEGGQGKSAMVLIDGKKPSEFPEAYRVTRPAPGPWSPLFLSRVDHEKPLVLEKWTLRLTRVSADGKSWEFVVKGSITGEDGDGRNDQPFTSKSGRVAIDPQAWFPAGNERKAGYEIRWQVLPMFVDAYTPSKLDDPSREYVTTLVQGIRNERHRLEIIGEVPIRAIRIYRPPAN